MVTSESGRPCSTEDPLHIGRGRRRVLEVDLPDRSAGVVDRELEAQVSARKERQQDEDDARDRDREAQRIEPAPLADDIKHERWLPSPERAVSPPGTRLPGRRTGPPCEPTAGARPSAASSRLSVIAVNIEISTPMISTSAKPRMVERCRSSTGCVAVIRLDTFESRIEFQARLKPASMAARQRLAGAQLFLGALEDQDVGVHRHAHREHEGRDTGERQRHADEPEQRVHHERVEQQREARHRARAAGSG